MKFKITVLLVVVFAFLLSCQKQEPPYITNAIPRNNNDNVGHITGKVDGLNSYCAKKPDFAENSYQFFYNNSYDSVEHKVNIVRESVVIKPIKHTWSLNIRNINLDTVQFPLVIESNPLNPDSVPIARISWVAGDFTLSNIFENNSQYNPYLTVTLTSFSNSVLSGNFRGLLYRKSAYGVGGSSNFVEIKEGEFSVPLVIGTF